jgi:putative ABC transport system permease protein
VRTGKQVAAADAAGLRQFLDVVRNILLGFAGITLFVGVFLIINTFSILVAQRTRELALLRALGASRRQVLGSVLIEAAVIGLLASTIGVLAGFGLSALLRKAFEAFGGSSLPSPGTGVAAAPHRRRLRGRPRRLGRRGAAAGPAGLADTARRRHARRRHP